MSETRFEYSKPSENEHKKHRLDLSVEGRHIGHAELEYFGDPFPFYYFSMLYVRSEFRNQKLGSELLKKVNEFLDSKGRPGVLINAAEDISKGMFEKSGWQPIPDHEDYYTYGISDDVDSHKLYQVIHKLRGASSI